MLLLFTNIVLYRINSKYDLNNIVSIIYLCLFHHMKCLQLPNKHIKYYRIQIKLPCIIHFVNIVHILIEQYFEDKIMVLKRNVYMN